MLETRASERDDECVVGKFVLAYHCYYTRLPEIFQLFTRLVDFYPKQPPS